MKRTIWALFLFAGLAVQAQTFHLTAVQDHIRQDNEPSFSKALHTRIYTGTVDGLKVIAEEAVFYGGPSRLTIGHDYAVTKFKPSPGGALHVKQDPDKKGRTEDAWLQVVSVSE